MELLLRRFDVEEFKLRFNGNLTTIFSLLFDNLVNVTAMQSIISSTGAPSNLITTHLFLGDIRRPLYSSMAILYGLQSNLV